MLDCVALVYDSAAYQVVVDEGFTTYCGSTVFLVCVATSLEVRVLEVSVCSQQRMREYTMCYVFQRLFNGRMFLPLKVLVAPLRKVT